MAPSSHSTYASRTVLLFGDQTDPWVERLDQLHQESSDTPWLRSFFDELTDLVRTELSSISLDRALSDSFGHFSSLYDLGEKYRHTTDELGVVRTLLLHAVKAATLLQYVKHDPQLIGPESRTEYLGISGGLLTMSALPMADDFESLYTALLEVTPLIIRFCKVTSVRSRAMEDQHGAWGWAVLGISPEELSRALDKFQRDYGVSSTKRARVGIIGNGWSTAIGPPSVLRHFFEQCPAVRGLANNPLEIEAMQHALTISASEVDFMLGSGSSLLERPLRCPDHIIWGLDTPESRFSTWGDLLRAVCLQVLSRPLNIPQVFKQLDSKLVGTSRVTIHPIGPCGHTSFLSNVLGASGKAVAVQDICELLRGKTKDTSSMSGRIAIVGMAGRGPGSDNVEDLWNIVMSKEDLCQEVPKDRFDSDDFYCATHERSGERCKMTTNYGCFMNNPGHFDSRFFHISPREAVLMDPGHRQFLMAAYEALESAGYQDGKTRTVDPNRIAAFYAQATDDWLHQTHPSLECDAYTMQGVQRAFGPGRLAWQFKWEGPTYSLDSACAGTTADIHLACMSLLSKDIDMAVSGAANILSWPHSFTCLCDSGVLSDTGNCKTFRNDADGYCRADFAGAVVLKRLEDAVAHNDKILAVVAGSERNHSGNSTSITTSDAEAQERLFRKVLGNARASPDEISYVEMHGTGTPVGDPAEMGAVSNLFRHRKRAHGLLPVGGIKANLGHSEAAAGMAELLKVIMMFKKNIIPPQAGLPHSLNPRFPSLHDIGIEIPLEARVYPKDSGKSRKVLLNNFDAAGGNACMVIEDYSHERTGRRADDPRSSHNVTISARTPAAYDANIRKLTAWLQENSTIRLQDISYTTTARRMHHPYRFACSASSTGDLIKKLEAAEPLPSPTPTSQSPPVVFAFTGQGSHYPGMGVELYHSSIAFRETVDLCVSICQANGFPSFLDIITHEDIDLADKNAAQTQLAVVTLEIALTSFWRSVGVEPTAVMGHSLGEYVALHISGVVSLADTLYLVGQRALLLMERCEAGSCAMLSLTASAETVRRHLEKLPASSCGIACTNGPNATVVSGTKEDVAELQKAVTADNEKVRSTTLAVPFAFHSFQMDSILQDYSDIAVGVTFSKPRIPVASILTGTVVDEAGFFNEEYLSRQTRQAVNFVDALNALNVRLHIPVWLEVGPAPVCASFVRATLSPPASKVACSLEPRASNWTGVTKALALMYSNGVSIDWLALHRPFEKNLELLSLPAYAWTLKDYWVTFKKDSAAELIAPSKPSRPYHTTCAQYLVSESSEPRVEVTFSASICDPGFAALIDGHKMQQIGLGSGSVFCDAALTAAKHALELSGRKNISVAHLAPHDPELLAPLTKSLVGSDGEILTSAVMESQTADRVLCSFEARSAKGTTRNLGSIMIKLCDPQKTQAAWDQVSYFIKTRTDELIRNVKAGSGHRMQPDVLYALFATAVEFDSSFKGIQEGYVAKDFQEAAATVILEDHPPNSSFTASPYWAEALVHLAGFMVQENPAKSPKTTFIVMGFDSAEQTTEFEAGKEYLTYTRINRWEDNTAFCDAYVFDPVSSRLLMQCRNLRYTELPRATWRHILEGGQVGTHGGNASAAPAMKQKAVATTTAATEPQEDLKMHAADQSTSTPPQLFDRIVESIAKSTGTDSAEFTDQTQIADLGVDSIMAIEIVSVAKAEYDLDLPAKFVFEYSTIGDLRREFGSESTPVEAQQVGSGSQTPATDEDTSDSSDAVQVSAPRSESSATSSSVLVETDGVPAQTEKPSFKTASHPAGPIDDKSPQPNARVTLLQGRSAPGRVPLYMMADGTGSVATYLHLPRFKSKTPVYGIDSPYLHCPSRLTSAIGIEGVAKLVIEGLIKHQPKGPLMIGGFSAGCHVAYEVARQLGAAGRPIEALVLIDLRAPLHTKLSASDIRDEAQRGVAALEVTVATDDLWNGTAAARQDHLRAYFVAMRSYDPPPMKPAERPAHAAIIWAERGIVKRAEGDAKVLQTLESTGFPLKAYEGFMQDPRLSPMGALIPDKTAADLGANGWDQFVGELLTLSVDGDHLDICMPTHVHLLHEEMEKAFRQFGISE